MNDLERRFQSEMENIYRQALEECAYNATYFHRMLAEYGGVGAAKRLLASSEPQEGFTKLWECGRLNLTVEAHVIRDEFRSLFTRKEILEAERRLREYNFEFPDDY